MSDPETRPSESPDSHEPFVRALAKHERLVRAYIRMAVNRPEDVDEIMQEVSLIAWEKFHQLRNVEEFPRWACVIARYQILRFRRQRARDRLVLNDTVYDLLLEEGLDETPLAARRLILLEKCLSKLPDQSRRLVLEAYAPGSSIDDLARRQGKKANALYQQLWRLRRALADCVEASLDHDRVSPFSPT